DRGPSRNASTMPSLVTLYTPCATQPDVIKSSTEGPGGCSFRSNRRSLRRTESTARAMRTGGSLGGASEGMAAFRNSAGADAGYFWVARGLPIWSAATKFPCHDDITHVLPLRLRDLSGRTPSRAHHQSM